MKLEKREIIILVIAALFVLYAIYVYLIAPPAGKKVKDATTPAATTGSVNNEAYANDINAELAKNRISDFERYVVKRAGIESHNNPFLKKDLYREWLAKDNKVSTAKLVYSGYVDSRKNIIAIINGVEYKAGEKLVEEGYVLKSITPSKVLIFDKSTGINFEIPIQE